MTNDSVLFIKMDEFINKIRLIDQLLKFKICFDVSGLDHQLVDQKQRRRVT